MNSDLGPDEIAVAFGLPLRRALERALADAHVGMTAARIDGPAQTAVLCTSLSYLLAEQIRKHAPEPHRYHVLAKSMEIATTALLTGDTNPDRRHLQ